MFSNEGALIIERSLYESSVPTCLASGFISMSGKYLRLCAKQSSPIRDVLTRLAGLTSRITLDAAALEKKTLTGYFVAICDKYWPY